MGSVDEHEREQYRRVMGDRATMGILPIEDTFVGFLGAEYHDHGEGDFGCTVPVHHGLMQPMGIVHGGIYAAIAETVASMGAARAVGFDSGMAVMGQSNNTTFLRPVAGGSIHAVGRIIHHGRTTIVWQIDMRDDDGRLCAVSQVTIAVRPMRTA